MVGARPGARVWVAGPSWCRRRPTGTARPSHVLHEPIWARFAEAGAPVLCHVGFGTGGLRPSVARQRPPAPEGPRRWWREPAGQGLPVDPPQRREVPDVPGARRRLRAFPELRCGVIELGASWVPGFLRSLDAAAQNFTKFEPMHRRAHHGAVGLHPSPGEVHAVPVRRCRLAHRAGGRRAVPVLLRLPPPRRRPRPDQPVRRLARRGRHRRRRPGPLLRRQLRRPVQPKVLATTK